jgi:enoyl-CoA hydratase/carnithine racemase
MANEPAYADRWATIHFERRDGILLMRLHTDDGPLRWGAGPVRDLQEAFGQVAADAANRVVILTGTGDEFNGPRGDPGTFPRSSARGWESAHWNVRRLLWNLLDIEALVIAAINGPVWRHAETPLLSDIVLASDDTVFADSGHFVNGLVPGDGMNLIMPLVMGINRARYYMLTGQVIDATTALQLGMVNEVLPGDQLLPRAWELAEEISKQSVLVTRYTRAAFTHTIRQLLVANHGYGLMLEGMACVDDAERGGGYDLTERL